MRRPQRIAAQVMDIGDDDVQRLADTMGDAYLRRVIAMPNLGS